MHLQEDKMNLSYLLKTSTYRLNFPIFTRPIVNVIFFGSDNYALPHLHALEKHQYHHNDIQILCVVTTSDKTPVGCHCIQNKIDHVIWPRKISNTSIVTDSIAQRIDILKNRSSDKSEKLLGIIVSFGRFLPPSLLSLFSYGCYNIHPSLLPRWKGSCPLLYTLLSGDRVTGITLFRLDPHHTTFDSGSVLYQQSIHLPSNGNVLITPEQLTTYLIPYSIKAMFEVILHPNLPHLIGIDQSVISKKFNIPVSYARIPQHHIGIIDWEKLSAKDIIRCWYAFQGSSVDLSTELCLLSTQAEKEVDPLFKANFRLVECPFLVPEVHYASKNDDEDIGIYYANYDPKVMNYLNEAATLLNQPYSSSLPPGSFVYLRSQIDAKHHPMPFTFIACKPSNSNPGVDQNHRHHHPRVSWIAVASFLVNWPNSPTSRHLTATDLYNGYFVNQAGLFKLPSVKREQITRQLGVRYFGQFQCVSSSSPPPSSLSGGSRSSSVFIKPWTELTPSILPSDLQLSCSIPNVVQNANNK
ncbi:unnamed protein product [Heterobilharzia americana]|nr:unnamed protein product [Heterobilharzia americana]